MALCCTQTLEACIPDETLAEERQQTVELPVLRTPLGDIDPLDGPGVRALMVGAATGNLVRIGRVPPLAAICTSDALVAADLGTLDEETARAATLSLFQRDDAVRRFCAGTADLTINGRRVVLGGVLEIDGVVDRWWLAWIPREQAVAAVEGGEDISWEAWRGDSTEPLPQGFSRWDWLRAVAGTLDPTPVLPMSGTIPQA